MEEQLEHDLKLAGECIEEIERQRDNALSMASDLADAVSALILDLDDYGRRTEKVRSVLARISAENDQGRATQPEEKI